MPKNTKAQLKELICLINQDLLKKQNKSVNGVSHVSAETDPIKKKRKKKNKWFN